MGSADAHQVEGALASVDDSFLRLHGVPAGRALDLYGRTLGGTRQAAAPQHRTRRRAAAAAHPSASTMK